MQSVPVLARGASQVTKYRFAHDQPDPFHVGGTMHCYAGPDGRCIGAIVTWPQAAGLVGVTVCRLNGASMAEWDDWRQEVVAPRVRSANARAIADGHMTIEQAHENERQLLEIVEYYPEYEVLQ